VLFGSQIFGWIGDHYGRKMALILANFLFDVLTFAAAYSTNLTELSWRASWPVSASAELFPMW
jgi:MFS family permease